MRTFVSILVTMLHLQSTLAQDSTAIRKRSFYAGIHFAGNTGFLSVNAGAKFINNRLSAGVGYGYLHEAINGTEVHTIYVKTSYNFTKGLLYKDARWYIGFTTFYGITDNTFIKLPSRYPENYYAPTAIHVSPFLGLSVPLSFYTPGCAQKTSFKIELGTVDNYLWYHILNREVSFWDICNLSYGLYFDF